MDESTSLGDEAGVFELSRAALDDLPFGVITLDRSGTILRYNRQQEITANRSLVQTVGLRFFIDVAPCANVQAFRGRFDAFAQNYDSGAERFAFSFAFSWGRHDVAITMLRKAGHAEINVLIHGQAISVAAQSEPAAVEPSALSRPLAAAATYATFLPAQELVCPVICSLEAADRGALARRVHPDDLAAVGAIIATAARERTAYATEYRGVAAGARQRFFLETGHFDLDPKHPNYATIIDVTERRQRRFDAEQAAHYDQLTELPNRQLLLVRIAETIRRSADKGRITGVLSANISGFRAINEAFGYEAGDALLRTVASRLCECVRGGDTVARIAGDSFVVLSTAADTPGSVGDTARKLIAAVARPVAIGDRLHYVALRVGISLAPYDGTDPLQLLYAADAANVAAKGAGRNGVRFYSSKLTSDAVKSREQQNELQAALESDEFELLYQPLVDIKRHRVVAVEALIRWNHPTRGLVSPLEFIPLADRTGLIVPLGEWVLRTACRQARAWADLGLDLRVCVNVSAVQFQSPNFLDLVASVVAEMRLAPGQLELELTEGIVVEGFAEMMESLTRLKTLGIRLAIDDFGTGYSSLSYLKYFPVDTLKIDRSFIIDVASDEFDQAIVTAVFALTKSLELECIVEGVEDLEQLETLMTIGCTIVQGYYFCKPSTAAKLAPMLGAPIAAAAFADQLA
jgi:photoactive yellow protein